MEKRIFVIIRHENGFFLAVEPLSQSRSGLYKDKEVLVKKVRSLVRKGKSLFYLHCDFNDDFLSGYEFIEKITI